MGKTQSLSFVRTTQTTFRILEALKEKNDATVTEFLGAQPIEK